MAIRKEQVLALCVLAIGGLVYAGLGEEDGQAVTITPKKLEYTASAVRPTPLAGDASGSPARAALFTEPRETRALPPRELAFPPRQPLSFAALPLDCGPDFAHLLLLREAGTPVEGFTLQMVEAAVTAAETAEPEATTPTQTPAERDAMLAATYDQLYLQGLSAPYFGFVEVEGMDPFDAEALRSFDDKVVRFRQYSRTTGKIGRVEIYDKNNVNKVREIRLANTLRNEVQRQIRAVPVDAGHLGERGQLITWLLGKAREAAWVYDEALAQAVVYSQCSGGDLEGLRWQLRVLQAKGDLAGEYALLEGIRGDHRETAFRYEGIGRVKHKLGLVADAEVDLRRATELGRNDARPHAALAEFLRSQGRSRDAVAAAARAEQTITGLQDANDKVRVVRAIVGCRLAVGDLDGARAALSLLPPDRAQPYLVGCIAYTAGDLPAALAAFRQASAGADAAEALLGQAAVLLRQQAWQEAYDAFVAVADQAPLLRHRAFAGISLLCQRLNLLDPSLTWADRALEADPQDPYALYLRGRTLRLQGQLGAAQESLTSALRLQDDFVHAVAEMAAVQSARASSVRGEEQAQATLWAKRYGDRAVALAPTPTVELFELQALYRFAAGNFEESKQAFGRARDTAASDAERLFSRGAIAVVDYSRGQVDDATAVLQRFGELPKEDPMRQWAETTLLAIDDHAEKEMLEDRFERPEPGAIWPDKRDGGTGASIVGNRLVFHGPLSRTGIGEVWAERAGAVPRGKNFLAVGCTMQLGAEQPRGEGFAGLRIETQRGSTGQTDTQIQVGIREGKPHVRVVDNREEAKLFSPTVEGFDPAGLQELEVRVLPRGEQQARLFTLQVRWNGQVVHTQELKSLGGSTASELRTVLFASGPKGSKVDVAFDDYRLERRKERK
jgi:tetratricopeptide (TPR) repeat protein